MTIPTNTCPLVLCTAILVEIPVFIAVVQVAISVTIGVDTILWCQHNNLGRDEYG